MQKLTETQIEQLKERFDSNTEAFNNSRVFEELTEREKQIAYDIIFNIIPELAQNDESQIEGVSSFCDAMTEYIENRDYENDDYTYSEVFNKIEDEAFFEFETLV